MCVFVCSPFGYSGTHHWSAQWHFPTMLCMLWNVFEVAHHVGACACVCMCDCVLCAYFYISSHPVLSAGSHLSAPDLPTSGHCTFFVYLCVCVCVCVWSSWPCLRAVCRPTSDELKSGLPVSTSPFALSGPLTHHISNSTNRQITWWFCHEICKCKCVIMKDHSTKSSAFFQDILKGIIVLVWWQRGKESLYMNISSFFKFSWSQFKPGVK